MKIRSNQLSTYHQNFGTIAARWDWDESTTHSPLKEYIVQHGILHLWLIPDVELRDQVLHNSTFLLSMLSAPIDNVVLVRFFRAFSMEKTRALFEDVVATLQQHTYVKGKRSTDLQDMEFHHTALRYGRFLDDFMLFLSHNGFPFLGLQIGEFQLELIEETDDDEGAERISILENMLPTYELLDMDAQAEQFRTELVAWYEDKIDDVKIKYKWLELRCNSLKTTEERLENIMERMSLCTDESTLLRLEYQLIENQIRCNEYIMEGREDTSVRLEELLQRGIEDDDDGLIRKCWLLQCEMITQKEEYTTEDISFIASKTTEIVEYYFQTYGKEHPSTLYQIGQIYLICDKIGLYEQALQYLDIKYPNLVMIFGQEHFFSTTNTFERCILCFRLKRYDEFHEHLRHLLSLTENMKDTEQRNQVLFFSSIVADMIWSIYGEQKEMQSKRTIINAYKMIVSSYSKYDYDKTVLSRYWFRMHFFSLFQSRIPHILWQSIRFGLVVYFLATLLRMFFM